MRARVLSKERMGVEEAAGLKKPPAFVVFSKRTLLFMVFWRPLCFPHWLRSPIHVASIIPQLSGFRERCLVYQATLGFWGVPGTRLVLAGLANQASPLLCGNRCCVHEHIHCYCGSGSKERTGNGGQAASAPGSSHSTDQEAWTD